MFSKRAPHGVSDFSERGPRFDGGNHVRYQIIGAACGALHRGQRLGTDAAVSRRADCPDPFDLTPFDLRIDGQQVDVRAGIGHE